MELSGGKLVKTGDIWPTYEDSLPREWGVSVPSSTLLDDDGTKGVKTFSMTQSPESVERDRQEAYPLYRAVQLGRRMINGFRR